MRETNLEIKKTSFVLGRCLFTDLTNPSIFIDLTNLSLFSNLTLQSKFIY